MDFHYKYSMDRKEQLTTLIQLCLENSFHINAYNKWLLMWVGVNNHHQIGHFGCAGCRLMNSKYICSSVRIKGSQLRLEKFEAFVGCQSVSEVP